MGTPPLINVEDLSFKFYRYQNLLDNVSILIGKL